MKTTIRYFIFDDEHELVECNEQEFLSTTGAIEYERHTVFENGVA